MSDKEVTCPYCDYEFEVDTDDGRHYDEGKSEEETCPNCEKIMLISSSCSWYRSAEAADCLNTGKHAWGEWWTYWYFEDGENKGKFHERRSCNDCDKDESANRNKRLGVNHPERFDEKPIGRY